MTIRFFNFGNHLTFDVFEWVNGGALGQANSLIEKATERLKKQEGYEPDWLESDALEEELGELLEEESDKAWGTNRFGDWSPFDDNGFDHAEILKSMLHCGRVEICFRTIAKALLLVTGKRTGKSYPCVLSNACADTTSENGAGAA